MSARAHAAPDAEPSRREFRALYRAHFAQVWRLLSHFGVADANLEDAAQEVFIIVLRRFGAWESRASFRSWLYGVARRVASTQRRRQGRHLRKLAALPRDATTGPIDEQLADRLRLEALAVAVAELDPKRREVFVLAEIEGLSAPEIADALSCKLNTVYSRLRRARVDIEGRMAAYEGTDDGRTQ